MANLSDLADRMRALAKGMDDRANAAKIYVATQVINDLVHNTPVDTSRALSNWVVGLGSPNRARVVPHVVGSKGSSQGASIAETLAAAIRILREARPGESIFISNNLPYIQRLNDGSSSQQPAGFVERAQLIGRKATANVRF